MNPSLTALTASPLHEACIQGELSGALARVHIPSDIFNLRKNFEFISGNVEMVQLMIASGAQLEAYDVHFGPPLHIACAKGHVDCVKEMLNAGQKMCSRIYLFERSVQPPI